MTDRPYTRNVVTSGHDIQPVSHITSSSELGLLMSTEEMEHRLEELPPGELHLLADGEISLPNDLSRAETTLREIDELSTGRKRSRAAVQFGQLAIAYNDQPPATELVAVKYVEPRVAAHEFRMNEYVSHRLGHAATFRTIGFVKPDNDKVGLLTRYEHNVVSLDNTLFDPGSSAAERETATAIAAKYLSTLHGEKLGLVHGDAQAKNIAVDSALRTRYIDLEATRPVRENALGRIVDHPALNKLMDIGDFFALPDGAEDWQPTMEELLKFMDVYLANQSGSHQISEDEIFTLLAEKIL